MSTEASTPLAPKHLRALFPNLGQFHQVDYLPPLNAALREFTINTPGRMAMFLAQIGHESASLTKWIEDLRYSPERLLEVFPRAIRDLDHARDVVNGGRRAIAEAVYGRNTAVGARLGNTREGDGAKYIARGPHGLTGRDNYERHAALLELDLVEHPELLEAPKAGFRSAALFATTKQVQQLGDKDTREAFLALTQAWNGGYNGLKDRLARWAAARAVLGLPALAEVA